MRLSLALLLAVAASARADQSLAFVDVSVIPMDRERVLDHQTVVVHDGRIAAVGPASTTQPPRGATIIDGKGKYLIPGLGDAHAHLSTVGGGPRLAERAVMLYALNGVTMARSMYTEPHHADVKARVERGELLGPRLLIVSPPISGQNTPTPDAARAAIAAHRAAGYTVAKVMPGLSRATFDTLVVEARRAGMRLAGHIPTDVGLRAALAAGFVSVEHLDGFLESLLSPDATVSAAQGGFFGLGVMQAVDATRIQSLVANVKASGTTVVPTEFEMELFVSVDSGVALARRPEMQYAPASLVAQWARQKDGFAQGVGVTPERSARYRELRRRLLGDLNAAGVPIAAGSDAFNMFDVAGLGTFHEMETLVAAGLTPFQALTAATVNVARLMDLSDAGTIATGKVADLVLLDANPLGSVGNVRRQAGVMLRGRWMAKAAIDARLKEIAAMP